MKPRRQKKAQRRPKANTQQVIGDLTGIGRVDSRWQRQYNILIDLREQLGHQKAHLKQDAVEAYTGIRREQADVATNTYDRDWALGMLSSDQNALYEIEEAINRIQTGTYGICQLTGKPIPQARLNAIPWTRFTAQAERELEKRGELERGKARIGERERVPKETMPESYGTEEET